MGVNNHLLILTPGFPKDEDDSTCIPPLQTYLKAFKHQFPETKISVIAFQYPYSNETYQWHGIEVRSCNGKMKKGLHKAWTWRRAITLFRSIHHEKPVTQCHSLWLGECAMIGERIKKKFAIPHVVTLQGQDAKAGNKWMRRLDMAALKTVCLSDQQASFFEEACGLPPTAVIPWGMDPKDFSNSEAKKEFDIIGVGSLIPIKRYDLFIEVISELATNRPGVKCVLIGEGTEEKKLKQMALENGLSSILKFKGQLDRNEVLNYMQRSKVLLHTSEYEGQAQVFEEALAAGCRICSFQVGGAEASECWSVANNQAELTQLTKKALEQEALTEGLIRYPIAKTLEAYEKFYG